MKKILITLFLASVPFNAMAVRDEYLKEELGGLSEEQIRDKALEICKEEKGTDKISQAAKSNSPWNEFDLPNVRDGFKSIIEDSVSSEVKNSEEFKSKKSLEDKFVYLRDGNHLKSNSEYSEYVKNLAYESVEPKCKLQLDGIVEIFKKRAGLE